MGGAVQASRYLEVSPCRLMLQQPSSRLPDNLPPTACFVALPSFSAHSPAFAGQIQRTMGRRRARGFVGDHQSMTRKVA